jgi:mRNA interferase YafQ
MFEVKYTTRFKKDYKLLKKRGYDMNKLLDVIDILREGHKLPPQYKDHPLHGDYEGHRDCHIESDWILIYYKNENSLVLSLTRTGTHSDVF